MHYLWSVNITPTQCERHSTQIHLICVTTEINEFKNIWMNLNVNGVVWSSLERDGWYYNQWSWISMRESKVEFLLSTAVAGHEETLKCVSYTQYNVISLPNCSECFICPETTGKCILCGNKCIWWFVLSLFQQRWGFSDSTAAPDWSQWELAKLAKAIS